MNVYNKKLYNDSNMPFLADYLEYLLGEQWDKPFLSAKITCLEMSILPFAFGFLSLPLAPSNFRNTHRFKSDKKRGIFIEFGSNAVLFQKEIKEKQCALKKDIILIHRYRSLITGKSDDQIENYLVNHPYECEVIMTNVSSSSRDVTLLISVPNGSLPLRQTKYIQSKQLKINSFSTHLEKIQFYFPQTGTYMHLPSNISSNQEITAKSEIVHLKVGKTVKIKKIETF